MNCSPNYGPLMDPVTKDLVQKIFIVDPNLRFTLDDIKRHKLFRVRLSLFTITQPIVNKLASC